MTACVAAVVSKADDVSAAFIDEFVGGFTAVAGGIQPTSARIAMGVQIARRDLAGITVCLLSTLRRDEPCAPYSKRKAFQVGLQRKQDHPGMTWPEGSWRAIQILVLDRPS